MCQSAAKKHKPTSGAQEERSNLQNPPHFIPWPNDYGPGVTQNEEIKAFSCFSITLLSNLGRTIGFSACQRPNVPNCC